MFKFENSKKLETTMDPRRMYPPSVVQPPNMVHPNYRPSYPPSYPPTQYPGVVNPNYQPYPPSKPSVVLHTNKTLLVNPNVS